VDDPRTELPQRRTVAHVLMAAAAVMAVPTVATAFAAGTAEASTAVKVRYSGRGGDTFRYEKVFLTGGLRDGRGAVLVSRFHVDTLQPLLARLAVEVEQRPELLSGDVERAYFEHALRTTP
jgi:hypothetical protein